MSTHGLLGRSLGHSFSPEIHAQLWGCTDYALLAMQPEEARRFLAGRQYDWLNVTIPYKQLALQLCDVVDERAAAIGAVNTVVNRGGVLTGYNTDYCGMQLAMESAGIPLAGKKVLVLGSGGTSHTACAVARGAGAASVTVISRRGPDNYENLARHADAQVLINTTPVGMFPNGDGQPVELSAFASLCGVMDAVYNPLETRLVQAARARGIPATGGLPMLVEQGRAAAEYFSGQPISRAAAAQCLARLRRGQSNVVLIGMPGCGKTTVGRLTARRLGRPFVDLDALIEQNAGRTIPQIFAQEGEQAFRALETAAVRQVGAQHGLVIACGGGTPLRAENRLALAGNGRIYYLEADCARLSGEGRPLSSSPAAIRRLYDERHALYERLAHCRIAADATPEAEADAIAAEFTGSWA